MGLSFRVAPGVRIRASSRGLSAGVGPRAARVHVGTRGVGVSSGVGPVSAYTSLSGGGRRSPGGGGGRSSYGPTKTSIAAYERELRSAEREADIDKVATLETALVKVHKQGFPKVRPIELPPPDEVESDPIRERLEREAGIPELIANLGNGDSPPVADNPEPVDRYSLMREHRKLGREGVPFFKIADRIRATRKADQAAEVEAESETTRRRDAQEEEQERLDRLWAKLQAARKKVEVQLPVEIDSEWQRREAERSKEQARLDADWNKLQANDPMTTIAALEEAFSDNEAPAAPLNCEGDRTTVVMRFSQPEAIVPERKPAWTPGGKRTLKKRTKTERNELYLEALASNVLATVMETLAVAPGTRVVQMLVIRRETDKKYAGELAAIYIGEFRRAEFESEDGFNHPSSALISAPQALLNLKGKTQQVTPIDLSDQPELHQVIEQVAIGLKA